MRLKGRVTNITDYGAFVELEPGIEGLIHVSEMSWTKKNVHPGKIISTSQEVEVQVLEVDSSKRRISLGLKQTLQNPWEAFAEKHPIGSEVEGEVKNKTEFGLFIGLDGDVDGMVHLSDLDWNKPGEQVIEDFKKGDIVRAKVLDVDMEKERISLGVKQLAGDPFAVKKPAAAEDNAAEAGSGELRKGLVVTCEVIEVKEGGIEVKIANSDSTVSSSVRNSQEIAAISVPNASPSAKRSMRAPRPCSTAARARSQYRLEALEVAGREGSDRPIRVGRSWRFARRHPGRPPQGSEAKKGE